jgi:hypothetical protein
MNRGVARSADTIFCIGDSYPVSVLRLAKTALLKNLPHFETTREQLER